MGTLWKFCQRKTHFPADILNILSYYLSKSDKQLQRYGRHKKSDLCHPRGKPKVKVIPKVLSAMHNYWVNMSSNLQRKRFSSFLRSRDQIAGERKKKNNNREKGRKENFFASRKTIRVTTVVVTLNNSWTLMEGLKSINIAYINV